MATKQFSGSIVFAADPEPYDTGKGFGPSFNVRVRVDQPNAPRADDANEIVIYKKADSDEAPYLRSLSKGQEVSLIFTETKRGGHYSLVAPYDFDPTQWVYDASAPSKPQAQARRQAQPARKERVVKRVPTEADFASRTGLGKVYVEEIVELYRVTKEGGVSDGQDAQKIAVTAWLSMDRTWVPDDGDQSEPPVAVDTLDLIVRGVKADDATRTLIASIAHNEEYYNETGDVITALQGYGLSSANITDEASWKRIASIALLHASLIKSGMEEGAARSAVRDEFGLEPPKILF